MSAVEHGHQYRDKHVYRAFVGGVRFLVTLFPNGDMHCSCGGPSKTFKGGHLVRCAHKRLVREYLVAQSR